MTPPPTLPFDAVSLYVAICSTALLCVASFGAILAWMDAGKSRGWWRGVNVAFAVVFTLYTLLLASLAVAAILVLMG